MKQGTPIASFAEILRSSSTNGYLTIDRTEENGVAHFRPPPSLEVSRTLSKLYSKMRLSTERS